jgi:hypothetical protein
VRSSGVIAARGNGAVREEREMARKISGKRGVAIIAVIVVLAALAAASPASADLGESLFDVPELIASWAEE